MGIECSNRTFLFLCNIISRNLVAFPPCSLTLLLALFDVLFFLYLYFSYLWKTISFISYSRKWFLRYFPRFIWVRKIFLNVSDPKYNTRFISYSIIRKGRAFPILGLTFALSSPVPIYYSQPSPPDHGSTILICLIFCCYYWSIFVFSSVHHDIFVFQHILSSGWLYRLIWGA